MKKGFRDHGLKGRGECGTRVSRKREGKTRSEEGWKRKEGESRSERKRRTEEIRRMRK